METVHDVLTHFGVKGMKWGVRNDDPTSGGVHALVAPSGGLVVDPKVPKSLQTAAREIAGKMGERYGFRIGEIKLMDKTREGYSPEMVAYVEHGGSRGGSATIFVGDKDPKKLLKGAEDVGWFGEGTGNTKSLLTHESAHAIFHAEEKVKNGFFGQKVVGGHIEARNAALRAAGKEALRSGIPIEHLTAFVSGYAHSSGTRAELEAEMFAQYHWSPNPPAFIKVWGETLHKEMGVDPTPFREED